MHFTAGQCLGTPSAEVVGAAAVSLITYRVVVCYPNKGKGVFYQCVYVRACVRACVRVHMWMSGCVALWISFTCRL